MPHPETPKNKTNQPAGRGAAPAMTRHLSGTDTWDGFRISARYQAQCLRLQICLPNSSSGHDGSGQETRADETRQQRRSPKSWSLSAPDRVCAVTKIPEGREKFPSFLCSLAGWLHGANGQPPRTVVQSYRGSEKRMYLVERNTHICTSLAGCLYPQNSLRFTPRGFYTSHGARSRLDLSSDTNP